MEQEAQINSIGDILSSTLKDGAEYSNTAKTAIFFSFWESIVGKKYSENTKPYSYSLGKLFISCKNSFVLQEISMYKKEIIKKAKVYSKAVDIDIKDIVFSYKNWEELNYSGINEDDKEVAEPIDFSRYKIDDKYIKKIVNDISFLNESQKQKLLQDIRNNIIKQNLSKNNS